jgi:hypothetical protein
MKTSHSRKLAIRTTLTAVTVAGLLAAATASSQAGGQVGSADGTEHGQVLRFGVQFSPLTSMAIQLDRGQITAGGIGSADAHRLLAVTGGTGSFTGAAGSIQVVENGDEADTGSLVITLR